MCEKLSTEEWNFQISILKIQQVVCKAQRPEINCNATYVGEGERRFWNSTDGHHGRD